MPARQVGQQDQVGWLLVASRPANGDLSRRKELKGSHSIDPEEVAVFCSGTFN